MLQHQHLHLPPVDFEDEMQAHSIPVQNPSYHLFDLTDAVTSLALASSPTIKFAVMPVDMAKVLID